MSILSGSSGTPVKSVQRGTIAVSSTVNATVTAVDMSKSFLTLTQKHSTNDQQCMAYAVLTTSTNIQFRNVNGTATCYWELIEYV